LLLYVCKLLATSISLGSGASGGIFSPSLFMGSTLGGAFAALVSTIFPDLPISVPAFAMVGMGSMVGSSTGAAMTAVAMVFEMTRDYDIVLPMILAVAVALGVRRMLSRENIYTLKLVRRGHPIPKALHANMFMVRSARDTMDPDFMLVDEAMSFDEFLRLSDGSRQRGPHGGPNATTGMRHVVITRGPLIVGVLRVNTDLRRTVGASAHDVPMGTLARRNFTIVRTDAVVFDIISRLARRRAVMGVVVEGHRRPRADKVVGVITKEHIADEVARSVRMYPR
jgi:chloride channel protein, CIC family